ncbi:MAG: LacI family transcriptional regulator [Roseinatronobacter sp.]|uniref:LacI family DNA-binding transcriptional regulator n=1 Tax=Roseinatronobacter monicus TaxID=393481 RepID=UPI0012C2C62A|nr:MAG: LacI family transcriptional regulator [Roseinatronobacter sp.]
MSSNRKPTLADVARDSATSIATVSRAMSQPGLVQPDTLERIRQVAARLGYVPNRRARALVSGRSNTIGVVVPTLNSPIFSATLQEMQRAFSANGYQLLIASHEYDSANEAGALAQLISHGVDGLVVVGGDRPQSTRTMIDAAGVPLIQMWEGREGFDRVLVDSFQAGYLVTRYLLDLGHTRLGVICGHLRNNDRQAARVNGIRAALQERDIPLAQTQICQQPLSLSAGRAGCMTLLEMVPRPSAVIGTADLLAIGAMIEAQGRGIDVPDSISFAGIDNVDFAAHLSPSLTTVDIPAASIGAETAALMLQRLDDATLPSDRTVQLPVNLVVRHSTGPCKT